MKRTEHESNFVLKTRTWHLCQSIASTLAFRTSCPGFFPDHTSWEDKDTSSLFPGTSHRLEVKADTGRRSGQRYYILHVLKTGNTTLLPGHRNQPCITATLDTEINPISKLVWKLISTPYHLSTLDTKATRVGVNSTNSTPIQFPLLVKSINSITISDKFSIPLNSNLKSIKKAWFPIQYFPTTIPQIWLALKSNYYYVIPLHLNSTLQENTTTRIKTDCEVLC